MPVFKGEIKARVVEARFALSGKISKVNKSVGNGIGKWDVIASLDRKILQTELDRELSDFEKVRADFEIYNQKNSEPANDLEKYMKAEKQAALNASVLEVELAKARLDMCDLLSPVDGVVLDDSSIVTGLYVTPAGSGVKIIDTGSFFFEAEIDQKEISDFSKPKKCEIEIDGVTEKISGESKGVFSDGKRFLLRIPVSGNSGMLYGMKGKINF